MCMASTPPHFFVAVQWFGALPQFSQKHFFGSKIYHFYWRGIDILNDLEDNCFQLKNLKHSEKMYSHFSLPGSSHMSGIGHYFTLRAEAEGHKDQKKR